MGTPEFVLALRRHVGTAPLWLTGVTAVVVRDADGRREVLLVRRADNGAWTPVTGIVDPGEEPAVAARREVLEEADVVARAERLASVSVTAPVIYPNGDRTQYIDLTFRFAFLSGEAHPADGENTEARWFDVEHLPAMSDAMVARVRVALPERGEALFAE